MTYTTDEQLVQILELRRAGMFGKDIASALGLKANTVKSIISGQRCGKRSGITDENRKSLLPHPRLTNCLVCHNKPIKRGRYCGKHYYRKLKYGSPLMVHQHKNGRGPLIEEPIYKDE